MRQCGTIEGQRCALPPATVGVDCELVQLKLKEGAVIPYQARKSRPGQIHWKNSRDKIIRAGNEQGHMQFCITTFFVSKPHNVMVCIYKSLNEILDNHPLHSVDHMWYQIKLGACYFVSCDLTRAYWQLPLHKDRQEMTGFLHESGRIIWNNSQCGPPSRVISSTLESTLL